MLFLSVNCLGQRKPISPKDIPLDSLKHYCHDIQKTTGNTEYQSISKDSFPTKWFKLRNTDFGLVLFDEGYVDYVINIDSNKVNDRVYMETFTWNNYELKDTAKNTFILKCKYSENWYQEDVFFYTFHVLDSTSKITKLYINHLHDDTLYAFDSLLIIPESQRNNYLYIKRANYSTPFHRIPFIEIDWNKLNIARREDLE